MKLKKIASLALAGIMAVSMLAGCKDGGNGNSGSSSENTNTTSGYSAMLAKELKDTAALKYVTFADNNSDKTALEDWLGNFANATIITNNTEKVGEKVEEAFVPGLEDAVKLDDYDVFNFDAGKQMLGTWKVGTLYVADGSVNIGKVIKNIADKIDDDILKGYLKEKGTDASSVVSAKYSYVVSASVVNVKNTEDLQKNQSVNYVLVTITRTGVTE